MGKNKPKPHNCIWGNQSVPPLGTQSDTGDFRGQRRPPPHDALRYYWSPVSALCRLLIPGEGGSTHHWGSPLSPHAQTGQTVALHKPPVRFRQTSDHQLDQRWQAVSRQTSAGTPHQVAQIQAAPQTHKAVYLHSNLKYNKYLYTGKTPLALAK